MPHHANRTASSKRATDKTQLRGEELVASRREARNNAEKIEELEKKLKNMRAWEKELRSLKSEREIEGEDTVEGVDGAEPVEISPDELRRQQLLRDRLHTAQAEKSKLVTTNDWLSTSLALKSEEVATLQSEIFALRPLKDTVKELQMEIQSRDRALEEKQIELMTTKKVEVQLRSQEETFKKVIELARMKLTGLEQELEDVKEEKLALKMELRAKRLENSHGAVIRPDARSEFLEEFSVASKGDGRSGKYLSEACELASTCMLLSVLTLSKSNFRTTRAQRPQIPSPLKDKSQETVFLQIAETPFLFVEWPIRWLSWAERWQSIVVRTWNFS
ncbi:hypothetical protein T439DRAFT_188428 [Meredithblackwellia eburnea MCA 4105]